MMETVKQEIGSEFWTGSTPLDGCGVAALLPAEMQSIYTLCGRTALELAVRDAMPVASAYLPSYCCHTMIEPFVAKGIRVTFYDVFFTDTGIDWAFDENHDCDLVFLMDYFGFRNKKTMALAASQKAKGKTVIYDATHSMFCKGMDYSACDYVFGSFRKWFGVNAGFCAKRGIWNSVLELTQNTGYVTTRNTAFEDKRKFMSGEPVEKDVFLQAFSQAEESLETDYVGYAPDAKSLETLKNVNVEFVRQKRREHAAFAIEAINGMDSELVRSPYPGVGEEECPLFVPLQVSPEKRLEFRRTLIGQRVYMPIHWPLSDLHQTNELSRRIYDTELSFVCDQRYSMEDMKRTMEVIRSF